MIERVREKTRSTMDVKKSIYAIDSGAKTKTTQAPVSGNVDVEEFFVIFMQKVQLKFHSIALCLRNYFSKWLPLLLPSRRCYCCRRLVDELWKKRVKEVLLEFEEFKLFRLFFCVEYFHVFFIFALRSHYRCSLSDESEKDMIVVAMLFRVIF